MTTKEQERKALAKIRKIVEELGEQSYIGMAFEGCFEVAEQNIDNDWGCSMKQRAELAEQKLANLELDNRDLRLAIQNAKSESSTTISKLQETVSKLREAVIEGDDLCDFVDMIDGEIFTKKQIMEQAAVTIVEFADNPADVAFANAVANHRNAKREIEYFEAIKARIIKAKKAYAYIR